MNMEYAMPLLAAMLVAVLGILGAVWARNFAVRVSFAAGMLLLGLGEILRMNFWGYISTDSAMTIERCRLAMVGLLPGFWLVFSLTFARGNAGEFLQRWRLGLVTAFALPIAIVIAGWTDLIGLPLVDPATGARIIPLGPEGIALQILVLIGLVMALDNLERTLRSAVGTLRWRIKFIIIGLGAIMLIRIYAGGQTLLYSSMNRNIQELNSIALLMGGAFVAKGMTRMRSFAVDLYPSKGTLRNSPIVLLAGAYLLIIGVVAQASVFFGGASSLPIKNLLIMLVLLGIAALMLSDRVRLWTGDMATRYFRRPHYDYAGIWRTCAEKTASIVNPERFCREIAGVLSTTLEALSITIWRVDEARHILILGASTSLPMKDAQPAPPLNVEVMRSLAKSPQPLNIETCAEAWATALRDATPRAFPNGGDRIAVPLRAGGSLLGIMIVADRVRGRPLTAEDTALLRTIGDHLGASLLNLRLSERLLESRELEAFQKMSTFFIHDLKNTASSLSLLLENFRTHSQNPAFREDALKSISSSVTRLQDLILRLGRLRELPAPTLQPCNLREIVDKVLKEITIPAGVELLRTDQDDAPTMADLKQVESITANLILNSLQALPARGGEIRITTALREDGAILEVKDNGCGMSQDFLQKSLFHPFRTTKSGGMGIGLFQSRMFVESHGGRIEVESEEGAGSTFRVVFPPLAR